MTDLQKLDVITNVFAAALIKNAFEDIASYKELAKRLAALIDAEIEWSQRKDIERQLMSHWGPLCN